MIAVYLFTEFNIEKAFLFSRRVSLCKVTGFLRALHHCNQNSAFEFVEREQLFLESCVKFRLVNLEEVLRI